MTQSYSSSQPLPEFNLWDRLETKRIPYSFDLELTARCNNSCRHCYINLPAADPAARASELNLPEIDHIASQAVSLGALWVLITGGEPLLRPDFPEIYLMLKRKGLLVSVFTNACLVTAEHVRLFQNYPPRDIEVTVYGATPQTYERVTQKPGSYRAFRTGLDRLIAGGIKVRLKAMALRSNLTEMEEIARFCRALTAQPYRFDPLLHLRCDRDPQRNAEILAERLTPAEISALEQSDPERSASLQKECANLIHTGAAHTSCGHIFHCGAGNSSFSVGYDGTFKLCSTLNRTGCTLNLRTASLADAWNHLVPAVRDQRSTNPDFLASCLTCPLVNLCLWCPANADLECGQLDGHTAYFCQVAHARAAAVTGTASPPTLTSKHDSAPEP